MDLRHCVQRQPPELIERQSLEPLEQQPLSQERQPLSQERQPLESIVSPGATACNDSPESLKRHQPLESIERQPLELPEQQPLSHWNDSHQSRLNDDSPWSRLSALEPLRATTATGVDCEPLERQQW